MGRIRTVKPMNTQASRPAQEIAGAHDGQSEFLTVAEVRDAIAASGLASNVAEHLLSVALAPIESLLSQHKRVTVNAKNYRAWIGIMGSQKWNLHRVALPILRTFAEELSRVDRLDDGHQRLDAAVRAAFAGLAMSECFAQMLAEVDLSGWAATEVRRTAIPLAKAKAARAKATALVADVEEARSSLLGKQRTTRQALIRLATASGVDLEALTRRHRRAVKLLSS